MIFVCEVARVCPIERSSSIFFVIFDDFAHYSLELTLCSQIQTVNTHPNCSARVSSSIVYSSQLMGSYLPINLYMKEKTRIQMDTAVNSPVRRSYDKYDPSSTNKSHLLLYSTRPSTMRLSDTEQEIYSHSLIKEVMEQSKLKSVHHDINRIQQDLSLYAKPLDFRRQEFQFDSIPSKNKMYSSQCYAKINQIKEGLRDPGTLKANNANGQVQVAKERPQSATSRINTRNPKVSVTGLASYNFKTVRGGNSLAFNKTNHEQILIDHIIEANKRQYCSLERKSRILSKTSGRRFAKHKKNQQAILKEFNTDTQSYLNDIVRQSQENTLIYNERSKKLNFIKEYMEQEKVGYEEAAFIVNQIEGKQTKKQILQVKSKLSDPNDQAFLEGRRIPVQRKPLQVRHFCFIE